MPELFGNAYILPVVIVVVLLLALLLILMIKRRQSPTSRDVRSAERIATPAPVSTPAETPPKPAAAAVPADERAPVTAHSAATTQNAATAQNAVAVQPSATVQPPSPVVPQTEPGRPSEEAVLGDDPLKAVILDIVHGWGDLTSEDTNRLNLFRPDKVLAEAEAIELPKENAAGGYARTRLLAIRKYASDRQTEQRRPEPASAPDSGPVGVTEVVGPEAGEPTMPGFERAATKEEPSQPTWEPARPEGAEAGAGPISAGDADAGEPEQIENHRGLEEALPEGESEWSAPEPVGPSPWIEGPPPEESAAPSPWPEASQAFQARPEDPQSGVLDTPSPWSETPAAWDVQEPTLLEEVPFEPDAATSLVDTEAVGLAEAAGMAEAVPDMAEAVPDMAETTEPGDAEAPTVEDMTARFPTSDDSLSSLHVRVRTADELMALPPQERADMLAFLEPPELARIIETSDDRELKKAVVDVLENLGSPASLDLLRRCLEDPDQEIQIYALDAADRLLGQEE